MSAIKFGTVILTGLTVLMAVPAMADTTASGQTVTSTQGSLYDQIAQKGILSYFGIYRGAPVNDPFNSLQPDEEGNLNKGTANAAPQSLESLVTAGYKIDKKTSAGVKVHFMNQLALGQDIQMLDPSLYVSRSGLIDWNGLNVTGIFSAVLPVTKSDTLQLQKQALGLPLLFNISYDVPKTKLNVSAYTYIEAWVPTANATATHYQYRYYLAPYANYQFAKTVGATLWVDLVSLRHRANMQGFLDTPNDTIDIEPGVNWDINKYVSVNPFINIYPSKPTLAATSFQAVISAHAF